LLSNGHHPSRRAKTPEPRNRHSRESRGEPRCWPRNSGYLPLELAQTDDIPVHLRRLVALRDQTCQYPGGCDQPAAACEPHHVVHRADGGRTSLAGLKNFCWWHHHVVLHEMGWKLTVYPDGTSQVTSPGGKIIRSHSPPPGNSRPPPR